MLGKQAFQGSCLTLSKEGYLQRRPAGMSHSTRSERFQFLFKGKQAQSLKKKHTHLHYGGEESSCRATGVPRLASPGHLSKQQSPRRRENSSITALRPAGCPHTPDLPNPQEGAPLSPAGATSTTPIERNSDFSSRSKTKSHCPTLLPQSRKSRVTR